MDWVYPQFGPMSSWKTLCLVTPLKTDQGTDEKPKQLRWTARFVVMDPSVVPNADSIFTGFDKVEDFYSQSATFT